MPTLIFPTDNTALLRDDGPAFYQYTDRPIKPGFDKPWMGGRYGFVRDGIRTRWGILYPRFHEGIDIKPVARTANGEPLDEVRSIADGVVVHTNMAQSAFQLWPLCGGGALVARFSLLFVVCAPKRDSC